MNPTWVIMPVMAGMEMTRAALSDVLAQSVPVRLLVINQGCPDEMRTELERIAEAEPDRVFCFHHVPALLSLAATWNRALDFVWESGETEALVVNNDVRLHRQTIERLQGVMGHTPALFVTAVGVTLEQFDASTPIDDRLLTPPDADGWGHPIAPGGPDFSCFLISRACHARYRFDEAFVPAFCEDLDYHRRLMLDGEGQRIFSVNVPYLHLASGTLKTVDPQRRQAIERSIEQNSRAHYAKKWGGPVNQETFYQPFGKLKEDLSDLWVGRCGPTTPELQAWVERQRNTEHLSLADVGITPLHGLQEAIGVTEPLTTRPGEYLGIHRPPQERP